MKTKHKKVAFFTSAISCAFLVSTLLLASCEKIEEASGFEEKQGRPAPTDTNISDPSLTAPWERMMYVDKTDTFYKSPNGSAAFARYLSYYNFKGVYFYSSSSIIASSSNWTNFGNFLKNLSEAGVTQRGVASGSASKFEAGGDCSRYNAAQTDPDKQINVANLELEWWNGAKTWSEWNATNKRIANGTIPFNDFYEGWYKNMGSTIDTIAAIDQVKYSDRILLHCYQNGVPTYSYANAKSSTATCGRLDIIAKGARDAGKRIDLYIIISAEKKSWGANNDFSGAVLQNAAADRNPFYTIENQAYNNIYGNMTPFQKQWINFKGFVWFTKRYCYFAVPPR